MNLHVLRVGGRIHQFANPSVNNKSFFVLSYDLEASSEATWRTDLCKTKSIMDNVTQCICPLSGSYIVLLAKRNNVSNAMKYGASRVLEDELDIIFIGGFASCGLHLSINYGRYAILHISNTNTSIDLSSTVHATGCHMLQLRQLHIEFIITFGIVDSKRRFRGLLTAYVKRAGDSCICVASNNLLLTSTNHANSSHDLTI